MPELVLNDYALQQLAVFHQQVIHDSDYKLRLFVNDFTPDIDTVLGDLTQADFPGYSPISFGAIGSPTITINSHIVTITWPEVGWVATSSSSGNAVYGYYVTNDDGDELAWSQRGDSVPISMNAAFNVCGVIPRLTYQDKSTV